MKQQQRFKSWATPLVVACFLALTIVGTASVLQKAEKAPSKKTEKIENPRQPEAANEKELAQIIDQTIDSSEFAGARWGVLVASLKDGRVIFSRNADKLFTPASNMKIYTTAVALDLLGTQYRWKTSVYASAPADANGTVPGDLILYGRGAPDLISRSKKDESASLDQLADALYQRGVRHIRGNVIGDESYFRGETLGDGWQWNDVQWYFGAEPSALSIDDNEVDIEVKPPAKAGEPPVAKLNRDQSNLQITSAIATVKAGERLSVGIHRDLSDNNFHVWGELPSGSHGFGARLSVHNPAQMASILFVSALKQRQISVDGQALTRDYRQPKNQRFDPANAVELASVFSHTLAEVVRTTNKESVNLNAELILRTLGRERGGLLTQDGAEPDDRGDDESGTRVIQLWLERKGIMTEGLALHDGSGLSRLNLVTPQSTVGLLRAVSTTEAASAFLDSLPQAGTDGTLEGRLKEYKERVIAKTGSLTYDNSLSGYLRTPNEDELVFSIMANDQTGRVSSTRLIDQIVELIADYYAVRTIKPTKIR